MIKDQKRKEHWITSDDASCGLLERIDYGPDCKQNGFQVSDVYTLKQFSNFGYLNKGEIVVYDQYFLVLGLEAAKGSIFICDITKRQSGAEIIKNIRSPLNNCHAVIMNGYNDMTTHFSAKDYQ